ncbi:hypothetical protein ACO0LM_08675 [Undibacterium sp. Di26W]|uniref:hypothetical protein n=1 Tax=Undibacterium sp. Di26W TaxID=3413035 RepID=UPI003BF1DE12
MANIYKVFKDLIPNAPLLVGKVIVVEVGQCVITLPGGGQITARGNGVVGQSVFVMDGVIQGDAPNLTVQVIDV